MASKKVTLKIYGMTCEDCARTITRELSAYNGLKEIEISFADSAGKLKVDTDIMDIKALQKLPIFSGRSRYRAFVEQ